jgi:hypothetical protein
MISFLRSFIATTAERVTKLSEIPAASFPMVVPEHGQITTASILAEPDADLAPTFLASSKTAFVCFARSSGVVLHSCKSVSRPESVTTKRTVLPISTRTSVSRFPYTAPEAPEMPTTISPMPYSHIAYIYALVLFLMYNVRKQRLFSWLKGSLSSLLSGKTFFGKIG